MKNRRIRSRLFGFIVLLSVLQSCAIDPWRDESYKVVRLSDWGEDDLVMFIASSGYENNARSPYAVSMYLPDNGERVDSATVNAFSVALNGEEIGGLSLANIHSESTIKLGSDSIDLHYAPCCVFWIASNFFDLVHEQGEQLVVIIDYCITVAGDSECQTIERSFRAVVKTGLIQNNF